MTRITISFLLILFLGCKTYSLDNKIIYNYITATTFFPLTDLEQGSKHIIKIMNIKKVDNNSMFCINIMPDNIYAEYLVNKEGIILSAYAAHNSKVILHQQLKNNLGDLFPVTYIGLWSENVRKIILNGLQDFSIGKYFIDAKEGQNIILSITSTGPNKIKVKINKKEREYLIIGSIKKIRILYNNKIEAELTMYDTPNNRKLNGKLLSFEFTDNRKDSIVYFSPRKLKKIGIIYSKEKRPYVKTCDLNGNIIEAIPFLKAKPFPHEYWEYEIAK